MFIVINIYWRNQMKNLKQFLTEATDERILTIWQQLGGNKFKVMTGAKDLTYDVSGDPTLMFKLPSNFAKDGINYIKITLTVMDLYNIEFYSIKGNNKHLVKEVNGIYNDQLQEIFKRYTGLNTHL